MNQYNTGIFSCFLRLLPLYSSIFHQARRKNKTIGEKIDRKKKKGRSGGESNTQHERMKMTHEMMWNVRCARQTWAWATHVRVTKCESTRKCDVWSVLFTLYGSESCSQELQRSDPINQVREYHPASILHPKEMISDSVELCETEVCFLHIQLIGTNVWLPKTQCSTRSRFWILKISCKVGVLKQSQSALSCSVSHITILFILTRVMDVI